MFGSQSLPRQLLWGSLLVSSMGASLLLPALQPSELSFAQAEPTPPADVQEIDRVAVLGIAFGLSVAAAVGANVLLDGRRSPRRAAKGHPLRPPTRQTLTLKTVGLDQASHGLQRKLLRLLGEDHKIATRLVEQTSFKYPDKGSNWCVEKVIFDLERDRGRY
ncbi:hypothetical protein GS597_16560 [Synechococcales cyanobacterium C]|uniref:Uncharacterized protein n=1 Tax=Petrachloros mirabilis ULC683 TaxID=2781853 RepID=A0A8K2A8J0_9CYAN|nr:hypothetical protein [Petrachloros mirabilis]NCJ08089.1 hypothetical protein [Petrachloros mirabilis ULC683]